MEFFTALIELLYYDSIFYIVLGIIGAIAITIIPQKYSDNKFVNYFKNSFILIALLLVYVIVGFLTKQDLDSQIGCFPIKRYILEVDNILYNSISFCFIAGALLLRNRLMIRNVLFLESAFFLFKIFFINSFDILGLLIPAPDFSFYDFLGVLLRVQLLSVITEKFINPKKVFAITVLIIMLKIAYDALLMLS